MIKSPACIQPRPIDRSVQCAHHARLLGIVSAYESLSLCLLASLSPFARGLGLGTALVHLFLEHTLAVLFGFGFVDMLNEGSVD